MSVMNAPECTKEDYAELLGISVEVVRGWIAKGHIPSVKRGKHRLINLEAVRNRNLAECQPEGSIEAFHNSPIKIIEILKDESPIYEKNRFAEITGFPVGVIEGWLEKRYLPVERIGKHTAVNAVKLREQLAGVV